MGKLAVVAAQGLGTVAVAGVGLAFRRALVLVGAEMGGELAFEDAVDEALLELGEEAVGAEQILGLAVVGEQPVEPLVLDFRFHWLMVL